MSTEISLINGLILISAVNVAKKITQMLRLHPKSIILNELLQRADARLDQHTVPTSEFLEVTFVFESWQIQYHKSYVARGMGHHGTCPWDSLFSLRLTVIQLLLSDPSKSPLSPARTQQRA